MFDKDLIDQTKGFLDPDEGRKLYELAKAAGRLGPGLEIGSYCGKSALYLGAGLRESGGVLFSIDITGAPRSTSLARNTAILT